MAIPVIKISVLLLGLFAVGVESGCYFPAAFQGEFVTQSVMSGMPSISYFTMSITYDSIPVWGKCYRRIGSNVILRDDTGEIVCFKCSHLTLRSANVLQVHTAGLDMCYTSEEKARQNCPTNTEIRTKRARELMLYRTKGILGEPAQKPTFCPINGAYSFTYSVNDALENNIDCAEQTSEMADCPYGFGFNLKFKQCSFGNMEMSFQCLGDWDGPNGERYVALMDTQATPMSRNGQVVQVENEVRPRYRCALYEENPTTGVIHLSLSSDSTCTNHLRSPTDGYETLTLRPQPQPSWPSHVRYSQECHLPDWMQGQWQHLHVHKGEMVLKEQSEFKTFRAKCVQKTHEEKFVVFARSHCGQEQYKCIWAQSRGDNAFEYQIGLRSSDWHDETLCSEENFVEGMWVTQGRLEVIDPTPYPIIGEYTGVIPDTDALCAKLYSDCNNPEIMFYTIFNCFNRTEVYEEREYRCLGQWTENGLIYTYTERRDSIGHECFVGMLTANGDVYLREAGEICTRSDKPITEGMKMKQISKCYNPRLRWKTTTKRPIKALPSWRSNEVESGASGIRQNVVFAVVIAIISVLFR